MGYKNIPIDGGVSYKMEMTPEQHKHLKSLVIGLMVDMVREVQKIEREKEKTIDKKE